MMKVLLLTLALLASSLVSAQVIVYKYEQFNADSVRRELDKRPYFSLNKDNYLIVGTTLGERPTSSNSDAKFQLSISQRLTKTVLPFDTYLFIMYTQKAFWNVFQKSMPMRDLNFNPGIGLMRPIIYKNKYIGKGSLILEHESNGKDSLASRSWNKVTLAVAVLMHKNVEMQLKTCIPIIDSDNNRDILRYNGIVQLATSFMTDNRKFNAAVILNKRKGWDFNFNTTLEVGYKFNPRDNQYIFLQYYNGYGEGLLEYKQFQSKLRIGFVIKPQDFSFY